MPNKIGAIPPATTHMAIRLPAEPRLTACKSVALITEPWLLIIDDQSYAWPFSVFIPKQVFGPHTAKSQPTWIKCCTHLLLYGIYLWANLERDRHVGSSRPNQNDYVFFVIFVTHHKSYIETTDLTIMHSQVFFSMCSAVYKQLSIS